jgi:hypothetical protein
MAMIASAVFPIPQRFQLPIPLPFVIPERTRISYSRYWQRRRVRLSVERAACRPSTPRVFTGNPGERSGGTCGSAVSPWATPVSLDTYRSARNWLDEHRFYLDDMQCKRINSALKRLEPIVIAAGEIWVVLRDFEPDPKLNETYFLH